MYTHTHTHTHTPCTQIFIAASFIMVPLWKQSICPPHDQWIRWNVVYPQNGMVLIHRKEWSTDMCYNKNIILNETKPDTKAVWFHLCEMSRISTIETESGFMIARVWDVGGREQNDCYWVWKFLSVVRDALELVTVVENLADTEKKLSCTL
jgi:hypothetical protein